MLTEGKAQRWHWGTGPTGRWLPPPTSLHSLLCVVLLPSVLLFSVNIQLLSPGHPPPFTYLSACLSAVHFSPFSLTLSLVPHSSLSPFLSACPIPSFLLSRIPFPPNLSLRPLSFHFLTSIPLCPKLCLFCHHSLFPSVTSVLSHHLTGMRWVSSSTLPASSLLLFSLSASLSFHGKMSSETAQVIILHREKIPNWLRTCHLLIQFSSTRPLDSSPSSSSLHLSRVPFPCLFVLLRASPSPSSLECWVFWSSPNLIHTARS